MANLVNLLNSYKYLEIPTGYKNVELDLGCGKGAFTLTLAKESPKTLFVAVDIKLGRLRKLCNKAKAQKIENIIAVNALCLPLINFGLLANSISKVHIICPDPWPKNRHRKYRMLNSQFFAYIANIMKNNALLHIATDDKDYELWIKKSLEGLSYFLEDNESIKNYTNIKSEFKNLWERLGKKTTHLGYQLKV